MRGHGWRGGLIACVVGLGVINAVSAQALTVHTFKHAFGEPGTGPGQFKGPVGVAVSASSGNAYVADAGNDRVQRFDATGALLGQFDGGSTYEVAGKTESGVAAPTGTLVQPELIAVDDSSSVSDPSRGDVYVVDRGHGVIDKFSVAGEYISQIVGAKSCLKFEAGEAFPCSISGLAVDLQGDVKVAVEKGPIYSYTDALANQQTGECETEFSGVSTLALDGEGNLYFERSRERGEITFAKASDACATLSNPFSDDRKGHSIAVDPNARVVFLDNLKEVESFDLEGNPIESAEPAGQAPPFGVGHLKNSLGIGVNASTDDIYASDSEEDSVSIFEAITLPTEELAPLSNQQPRSVTFKGTVNPEGAATTECAFEYDTKPYLQGESAHGVSIACVPASPGAGKSPVPVSANVTGLVPQTTYYYRLVAENGGGRSTSAGGQFFTGPLVEGAWSVEVSAESATVRTRIDANGGDTRYYVEYGPTPAYGSYAPVEPPGVDLGATSGPQTLDAHIQNLSPASTYYYRVVAIQTGEAFGCDGASEVAGECDGMFATRSAPGAGGLLDGRGWELVSPPDKNGALIEGETEQGGQVQAASDGGALTYVTRGPSVGAEPAGHVTYSQVLSRREGAAWNSVDLTLPGRLPEDGKSAQSISSFAFEYRLFSPTLAAAAVEPQRTGTPLLGEASERTPYVRDNATGGYTALVTAANVVPGTKIEPVSEDDQFEWNIHMLAATPDLASVIVKTPVALTPEAITEESPAPGGHELGGHVQWNLYEWSNGELRLVNLLPSGPPTNGAPAHGKVSASFGGVRLAGMDNTDGEGQGGAQRDLSNDGRRVAWTWGEPYTPAELEDYRGLYVRDMKEGRTVRVGGPTAIFQTMNSEGTKIFYLENGELYVYVWEVGAVSGAATNLTATHELGEVSAEVQETVSDVSEDGSYVYFVAKGRLAPGGVSGGDNLYLLHEAAGSWTTAFIATLAVADRPSWYATTDGVPYLANISSRVSSDGRFLAFMSQRSLTGYDNVDALSGQRDEEVFLYDAERSSLVCASCDPTGSRPVGVFDSQATELVVDRQATWTSAGSVGRDPRTDHWLAGSIPAWENLSGNAATYQPRYLSNSGRLFFDSPDALVGHDTNGIEDAYEFEPEGVGGCTSATASGIEVYVREVAGHPVGGCVGLMSSGTSSAESSFLDASESGDDVFFVTTSKLAGADYDKGYDVYDAHVCTSAVPCPVAAEVPLPCASGDACKAPASPQPAIFGAPPSATFEGVGNVRPVPPVAKPSPLTKAQKLALALKACRKHRGRRRGTCERTARAKYAARRGRAAGKGGRGRRR